MKFQWRMAVAQPKLAGPLARQLGLSPLLAQCLVNRGLDDAEAILRFLDPRLQHLADPFLLPNMAAAVDRLFLARRQREPVVIFGDYDVDGVTATALLTEVLRALGWQVEYYLPHRMDEGYGLSQGGVENCFKKHPAKLLLAVDCGSTAAAAIDWLLQRGIETIVLDHHQVAQPPPRAVALVNPQLSGDGQPSFRELCSAGLAFKLAHALVKRGRENGLAEMREFDVRPYLELVALGTIADLVPLTGENRIMVNHGLARLDRTSRPGLLALKEAARVTGPVGTYEVGFQLAPRLNAAGRLENALDALKLLLARAPAEARALALQLDAQNRERQDIEQRMAAEAINAVRARFNPAEDYVIVEGRLSWHLGVVGIVASRVLREFYRPTIILGGDDREWRGSGRSIEGFDLAAALCECDELLVRHGGHAMAAGITLHPDQCEPFRERLNAIARRSLKPGQLQPALRLDAEITPAELTLDRLRELEKLQHTGMGNPAVQLVMRNVWHQRPPQCFGPDKRHVRLWVTDGRAMHTALWWGAAAEPLPTGRFDLAFSPQLNDYQGSVTIQLKVLDWQPAGSGVLNAECGVRSAE